MMCRLFHVSRSSYYASLAAEESLRETEDKRVGLRIKHLFELHRCVYGTRRLQRLLTGESIHTSRRRIKRLMQEQGLQCKVKRRFKATTDSHHSLPIAPNLLNREFSSSAPNRCWVADITYIPTREGWLYVAVVLDLFSRQIVGWAMDSNMKVTLVNQALLMAIWKRKPPKGLISHSDRGSQYASNSHRKLLTDFGIQQSMSRPHDCWDNAVAESFFHTLKVELVHQTVFHTRQEAKDKIFEYIEVFYNRLRLHSANDYLSPVAFESLHNIN